VELPLPLEAFHVDRDRWIASESVDLVLRAVREREQHGDNDHRHDRVEDLQLDEVLHLVREVVVTAPVAQDREDDQPPYQAADEDRHDHRALPQAEDVAPLPGRSTPAAELEAAA
jgi:hypothetical protein